MPYCYCLTIHASYACEHSGECCTAGWPVPVDDASVARLHAQGLMPRPVPEYVRPLEPPVNGLSLRLAATPDGACVFFDRVDGRLCRIHSRAGANLLPSACLNFPRVTLRDARGVFITLSHYCPTAARLLLRADEIAIVEAPGSLSLSGTVEGLDATRVLPPLLRPGVLMDLEGYARWEREAVAVLNDREQPPSGALAVIRAATRDACAWRPGGETLASRVGRAFEGARPRHGAGRPDVSRLEHATKAFMAAHLFASWAAYQQGGLQAVIEALETALTLAGTAHADDDAFIAAVRNADLRLRHG